MSSKINLKQVKEVQICYRISGLSFFFLLIISAILFVSINNSFLEETQYILLVASSILYITVPTIMNLFLSAPKMTPYLLEELNQNSNRYRWVEYFFSSSIMVISISIIIGVSNPLVLLFIAGVNATVIVLGGLADWFKPKILKTILFSMASILFSFYWFVLLRTYFSIYAEGGSALNSPVFTQLLLILIWMSLFPLIFVFQHFSGLKINAATTDKMYIVSGFATKAVLFLTTIFLSLVL